MKTRIIVAAIGLPLLLVVLLALPPIATAILIAAMSVLAVYELLYQTGLVRNLYLMLASAIMALAVCLWSFGGCPRAAGLAGLWIYFVALFAVMLSAHAKLPFQEACVAAFSGIVVPFLLSALTRILLMENGRLYILIPLILAFSTDSGAYFAGRAFGRHKLAPIVSPKKTWEGVIGGSFCAMVFMLLYALVLDLGFQLDVNYGFAAVYGVLGSAACVVGDLTFSVVKRQTGIKDYGNLIPGHGGALDRFDSLVLVAPLMEALLLLAPMVVV